MFTLRSYKVTINGASFHIWLPVAEKVQKRVFEAQAMNLKQKTQVWSRQPKLESTKPELWGTEPKLWSR